MNEIFLIEKKWIKIVVLILFSINKWYNEQRNEGAIELKFDTKRRWYEAN